MAFKMQIWSVGRRISFYNIRGGWDTAWVKRKQKCIDVCIIDKLHLLFCLVCLQIQKQYSSDSSSASQPSRDIIEDLAVLGTSPDPSGIESWAVPSVTPHTLRTREENTFQENMAFVTENSDPRLMIDMWLQIQEDCVRLHESIAQEEEKMMNRQVDHWLKLQMSYMISSLTHFNPGIARKQHEASTLLWIYQCIFRKTAPTRPLASHVVAIISKRLIIIPALPSIRSTLRHFPTITTHDS